MRRLMISIAMVASALLAGCASSPTPPAAGGTTVPSADATGAGGAETNPVGDIPDTQVFVDYAPPGGGYAVQIPQGWSRSS